jgi:hypothetical protein
MKLKITLVMLLAGVSTALAPIKVPFTSWDDMTRRSTDIVIARCTATAPDKVPNASGFVSYGLSLTWSDIEVVSVLKGGTKPGAARMLSEYWPNQGECLLLFASFGTNQPSAGYNAIERYRVVPLGHYVRTSDWTGKSLDEQIQWSLRRRVNILKTELEAGAEEMKRLEAGIKR